MSLECMTTISLRNIWKCRWGQQSHSYHSQWLQSLQLLVVKFQKFYHLTNKSIPEKSMFLFCFETVKCTFVLFPYSKFQSVDHKCWLIMFFVDHEHIPQRNWWPKITTIQNCICLKSLRSEHNLLTNAYFSHFSLRK